MADGQATDTATHQVTAGRRTWRLPVDADPERPDYAVVRRLVLGSALMLFLELALIRWLGSNIVHLSYFSNFVLLGSFLGIGLGFLIARKSWSVLPYAPVLLAVARDRHLPRPGHHRPRRRRDHLLHLAEHHRTARLAGAAAGLHLRRRRARRARRGGRTVLRAPAAADRLPVGPGRLADRHRLVHPDVVPAGPVGGVGRGGDGRRSSCCSANWQRWLALAAGAGHGRRPAAGDAVPRHLLVAVLQDPHPGHGARRHPAHRHLGERCPAPDHAGGGPAAAGGTAVRLPVPAHAGQPAGQRADHRRRLRLGRGDRPVQGRPAHRRRRHRPADHADRPGEEPRPPLQRPAGDPARQRRPGVPREHRQQVRPDPVRAARLAGPGDRRVPDPAGELPVHRAGADRGAGPPDARAAPSRCTTTTARTG